MPEEFVGVDMDKTRISVGIYDDQEVKIYCNREGLQLLINELVELKEGKSDHFHFMSPSWHTDG
ncbi:Imm32 family immunity protein [Candidatus Riflebacteria bacterium]